MFSTRVFIGAIAAAVMTASASSGAAPSRIEHSARHFTDVQATQSGLTRTIGTVKSIIGNTLTLTTDAGTDVTVSVSDTTRILQVAPGQKTLQGAAAIHLADLQVGDRILVLSPASNGSGPLSAGTIIAMKKSAVDAQHAQENTEWQRGIGGLVKSVDPASGTITITVAALGGTRTIAIHTTKDTVLRKYAPDSVKFDDAKRGTIDDIHPGDQVRARGVRSADENEFDAQEIVSGAFRNIAGTITSIDATANTLNVMDLISKKSYLVKFTTQSEIRQLSPQMAQGIAMRLRAAQNGGQAGNRSGAASGGNPGANWQPNGGGQGPGGFQRRGGAGDLQQMLSRLPAASLANLQKGEAVMIVSTEGAVPGEATAITLLGGVEAILEAPSGVQAMTLSPWSLGGAPGMGDDQQP